MAGTIPVDGNLTMDDLAATLTSEEQLGFEQLTALAADTVEMQNLATFINQEKKMGELKIVESEATAPDGATKILSPTVYISASKKAVDVYRLPLAP